MLISRQFRKYWDQLPAYRNDLQRDGRISDRVADSVTMEG